MLGSYRTQKKLFLFTMQGEQAYAKIKAPIETGLQTNIKFMTYALPVAHPRNKASAEFFNMSPGGVFERKLVIGRIRITL